MSLPKIALTIGDPAGVGAEITLKALADRELLDVAEWVVIADPIALEAVDVKFRENLDPRVRIVEANGLNPMKPVHFGVLAAEYGLAAIDYVRRATLCVSLAKRTRW